MAYIAFDDNAAETEQPRKISAKDLERMVNAGIIDADEQVELIDGMLVVMSPEGVHHPRVIRRLNELFVKGIPDDLVAAGPMSITLGDFSQPVPDFIVITREQSEAINSHPTCPLLVIEVAKTSLRKDRKVKTALYAQFGLPEYWIVNEVEGLIEVYREPEPKKHRYRSQTVVRPGEKLRAATFNGPEIDVAELLK